MSLTLNLKKKFNFKFDFESEKKVKFQAWREIFGPEIDKFIGSLLFQ